VGVALRCFTVTVFCRGTYLWFFFWEVFFWEAGCIDSEHGVFGAATKRIMLRKQPIRWELGVDGFGVGLGLGA
jgi:hypothetical protein